MTAASLPTMATTRRRRRAMRTAAWVVAIFMLFTGHALLYLGALLGGLR